jgi:hypothetical protein
MRNIEEIEAKFTFKPQIQGEVTRMVEIKEDDMKWIIERFNELIVYEKAVKELTKVLYDNHKEEQMKQELSHVERLIRPFAIKTGWLGHLKALEDIENLSLCIKTDEGIRNINSIDDVTHNMTVLVHNLPTINHDSVKFKIKKGEYVRYKKVL